MSPQNMPTVKTQMLIYKPVATVFEAFVDPKITTQFWFTKSSGRMELGKQIQWDWEMYGVSTHLTVQALEVNKRILIDWDQPPQPVEWLFTPCTDDSTLVVISTWGFRGSDDEIVAQAIDAMGGFTMVLANLKALLEHNIALNLIADHYPDNIQN